MLNLRLALQVLAKHDVEFIVVGGVAVAAHGSSLMTEDLDIVYRLEAGTVRRLLAALEELDARVYGDPRDLRFGFDHLYNRGHHFNATRAGRLDALGSLGKAGDILYEDIETDAVAVEAFGTTFLCISLDRLIAVKQELGRPRDRVAVMELEAIKAIKALKAKHPQ